MKIKKDIAFIIGGLRAGGAEKVCVSLINEFFRNGHNVCLIVLNLENEQFLRRINTDIPIHNLNKLHARSAIIALGKVLKNLKIDICLSFNFQMSVQLILLKKLLGFKYIIYSRGINTFSQKVSKEKSFRHKYFNAFIIKKLYNKSDFFIAQSTGMKKDMIQSLCVPESKIKIIFNPSFCFDKNNNVVQARKNRQPEMKEILFVGSLKEQKNIHFLLECIAELLKIRQDFIFRIVGDGKLRGSIQSFIKKLDLKEFVTLEGYSDNAYSFYKQANLLLLSSWYEGFPNVLVEALSTGIPVISVDCMSGPSDIIQDDVNGYLVLGYDKIVYASKIDQALSKDWDVDKILQSIEKFEFNKIYNQYEEYLIHE